MRIGSFALPDQVPAIARAGGDYVELFATKTFMQGDRDDFEAFVADARRWPLPPGAYSGLIPGDLKLCGPSVDKHAQDVYLDELFHRIGVLAAGRPAIATVGSAGAREVPDGFDRGRAREQIADVLRRAADAADGHGVTVTLEHLNRGESNIFTTFRETAAFLDEHALDRVRLIADLFHLMAEGEPLSALTEHGSRIVHAHVADSDRDAPGTGDHPFEEFFTTLRNVGFTGDCSIEAFWTDFGHQVDTAVRTVRDAAESAGFPTRTRTT